MRVTARAGRMRATAAVALGAAGGAPGAPGTPPVRPLTGRYFWAPYTFIGSQTALRVVWFASDTHAYVGTQGLPRGDGFPTCTEGQPAPTDDSPSGCVPYSYDAAAKTLTLGTVTVAFDATRHTFPYLTSIMGEAVLPEPGQTWNVGLTHINSYGFYPNQTVIQRSLTLSADGRFITQGLMLGSTFDSNFAATAPGDRGTYAVEAPGRVVMTYDDGTVVRAPLVVTASADGVPEIAKMGIVLGSIWYWGPDFAAD